MRYILALTAAALLSACGGITTHTAPAQAYRAKGAAQAHTITGKISRDDKLVSVSHLLTVSIDGQPAISGPIGGGNGDVSGRHDGKPALALCNRQGALLDESYSIHCRIVIDGEFAATLTF